MYNSSKKEVLPCNLRSGFIDRLLGFSDFTLDHNGFVCTCRQSEKKVSFAELADLRVKGQTIEVVGLDGVKQSFRLPGHSRVKAETFKQVFDESVAYKKELEQLHKKTCAEKFTGFKKCFAMIGAPYVRALEMLLATAAIERISDFHFEPMKEEVKLTFRRQGRVVHWGNLQTELFSRLIARVKFLASCRSHIIDQAQEGAFRDEKSQIDVRVSTFPTDFGERLSLRFIQPCHYQQLELLGWPEEVLEQWRKTLHSGSGLYIISGPVGSGKTTALYASLAELAQSDRQLRVVTIEDPVEGQVEGICQSSLDSMRNMNLTQAFKHLLRQDPDVIALGEIRDRDCLKEALQAGLSGHRVLATFHAGRGAETMLRIRQMGLEDYLVLQGLRGIISLELRHQADKISAVAEMISLNQGNQP